MLLLYLFMLMNSFVLFKQKTAYEMRISDWSSDVCSSDLKMLVAGDFSNPDQSQANHHSSSHFYLSDIYASYLSRFALSTDSGHGLKLCIEKDRYGRRGENAARRQRGAAVACLVRQSDRKSTRLNSSH